MKITATETEIREQPADVVVVGVHEEGELPSPAAQLDEACDGVLSRLIGSGEIRGKVGEVTSLLAPSGVEAGQVLVTGLGPPGPLDRGTAWRASATAAKQAGLRPRKTVAFYLAEELPDDVAAAAVCGAAVGSVGQDLYRREKNLHTPEEVQWSGVSPTAIQTGHVLADSVNLTRRLVNQPASEIYPESFADAAAEMAAQCGLKAEIWDEQRLREERCGSLLAVGQGSARPPRLVILTHDGAGPETPLLALVGKGVTFDSGGLSLKPTDGMKTMKCDMAGAATVVGAMQAIARLNLPLRVIGLVGLVENLISGTAYKLGDVLTARSGTTIEVLNTDAEGRLVLADVLDVAVQHQPARIVDLATLTGACVVALGSDVAGLMTNDQPWCDQVAAAAQRSGEPAWQLPMYADFAEQIRSQVADIKNVGEQRWGGAITAAKFLEEFVAEKPWVHIDIAGPAMLEKPKPWIDAGASGCFVRTLVDLAEAVAGK